MTYNSIIQKRRDAILAKTYRAITQWDHWLQHFLGNCLITAEKDLLFSLLEKLYGKHTLLIGSPNQHSLLDASVMPHHILLSPVMGKNLSMRQIESELYELPLISGSVDLVLLPHTLEHLDNPHHLLSEACRVVKPEGHIIVFGFNPFSMWGLKKHLVKKKKMPGSLNFMSLGLVKNWLTLEEFQIVKQDFIMYRPPTSHPKIFKKLKWLEWLGRKFKLPWGGVYMIMAQNKSIPLTPIKMRWKQQLSGVRVTIPKPTIRNVRNSP